VAVKVNLRIEIGGHKRPRTRAIERAVLELINRENLADNFSRMRRMLGDDLEILHFRTFQPVAVTGAADAWVRKLRKELRTALTRANRGKCEVSVRAVYLREKK
jgi:hypothetical protein